MKLSKITFIPFLVFVIFAAFSMRLVNMMTGISSIVTPAVAETLAVPEDGVQDIVEDIAQGATQDTTEEIISEIDLTALDPATGDITEGEFINALEPAAGGGSKKKKKKKKKSKPKEDKAAETENKEEGDDSDIDTPIWLDSSDSDTQNESVRLEIMQDLAENRDRLDKQEKDLMVREALLKATEKELDRKYQELAQLRNEIERLLEQQSDEEKARIQSLVKVYEGMKPKDAARIFDTLDLDILVSVMSLMSERKLSPVLANMNAERARTVTILLAEQKQLPTLPLN